MKNRSRLQVEQLEGRWCPSVMEPAVVPVEPPETDIPTIAASVEGLSLRQWIKQTIHWRDWGYWGARMETLAIENPGDADALIAQLQQLADEIRDQREPAALPSATVSSTLAPEDDALVQRARDFLRTNRATVQQLRQMAESRARAVEDLENRGAPEGDIQYAVALASYSFAQFQRAANDQAALRTALQGDSTVAIAQQLRDLHSVKDQEATTLERRAAAGDRQLRQLPNTTPAEKRVFVEASLQNMVLGGHSVSASLFAKGLSQAINPNP